MDEIDQIEFRLKRVQRIQSTISQLPSGKLRDHLSELINSELEGRQVEVLSENLALRAQLNEYQQRINDLEKLLESQENRPLASHWEPPENETSVWKRHLFWIVIVGIILVTLAIRSCGAS
jgi:vacuolar-type H+-ATPase subunit I/STV1